MGSASAVVLTAVVGAVAVLVLEVSSAREFALPVSAVIVLLTAFAFAGNEAEGRLRAALLFVALCAAGAAGVFAGVWLEEWATNLVVKFY